MNKIPENKTRKRLRITLCIFYLFEIVLCAWVFFQIENEGVVLYRTVFDMLGYLFEKPDTNIAMYNNFLHYVPFYFIFPIIPIVGFFFCALDKERNMKNIVSLLCCLLGVLAILFIVTPSHIALGSLLAMLLYILIAFVSSFSLMARIAESPKKDEQE